MVRFSLADERYAIEARFVREVIRLVDFTPVPAAPQPTSFRMVCSEPDNETDKVDQLYQAFQQAMQQTGGAVRQSRDNFAEFVSKKTKELQTQKNCREVEYVVEVVNGEVKLKALVKT